MTEIWKEIIDYPNYKISSHGKVKNIRTGKILTAKSLDDGFIRLRLTNYEGRKMYRLHLLIYKTFFPDIVGKYRVIHKNGNKLDNNIANLEMKKLKTNNKPIKNI